MPKINKIYYKTSIVQMLFGCLLFIGLVVNKHFIIVLLHKPEYANYFDVFIIVGLGFLADMTGGVNGYIINLSKHYKFTTYFIVTTVIICAIANWILIPKMGMMGAAVAYLLSMLILNLIYWFYVKTKFGMQPFAMAHLLVLLISAVTLAIGIYLPVWSNFWIDMILRSGIVLVIYTSLIYLFKVSEDVNVVFDNILKRLKSK